MHVPHNATLAVRIAVAGAWAAWAACLVIVGLWLVFDWSRTIPQAQWVVVITGIGSIAAGEFVFLVGVADRLFPSMTRRIGAWAVEMALFGVFLLCCTLVVLVLIWSAKS